MAGGSRIDMKRIAANSTVEKSQFTDVMFAAVTTGQLADEDHRINTVDKFIGKTVYELTLKLNYTADGPLPADTWTLNDGLGLTSVTPS